MTGVLAVVTEEVVVPVDPETAFRLYVTRPGRRHPVAGLSGSPAEIVYEPFVGGRWFERAADGTEHDWGRVLVWDPPRTLTLAWMVGAEDGRAWAFDPDPARASRAQVTFEPVPGGTRVRVAHTGFERHGAGGERIRRGVATGWAADLEDLRAACP